MPWDKFPENGQVCIYKVDEQGDKTGDSLGCHDTDAEANAQLAALYASEPQAAKSGARHSKTDRELLKAVHTKASEIQQHAVELGAELEEAQERAEEAEAKAAVKAITRQEADGPHPAGHYLVVEDPESPTTWHLRVRNMAGELDHGLMGASWAALHAGFRGNRYEGPSKQDAIAKLTRLYEQEDMPLPGKSLDMDDAVVTFGGAVKALGDGRIGGYLVRFSNADAPDLEGEYFDKSTNFGAHTHTPVLYQHGADKHLGKRVLDDDATLREDDVGIWIASQLSLRDAYERYIYAQVGADKMAWSSGTAPHLVERERVGKATRITRWPLGLDASITPTPAEPRNAVMPLKSLILAELELPAEEPSEAGEEPAAVKAMEPATPTGNATPMSTTQERIIMSDETKTVETQTAAPPAPDIAAIVQAAVQASITKVLAEMPAFQKAFVQAPEGNDHPETKSFGDYLVAVQRGDVKRLNEVYKSTKAMAETTGESGGYLVPPEYSNEILRLASEQSIIRPRARIVNATTRELNYPALDYTSTTAGKPHPLGGVVATWTEEAGTKTETEAKLKTIKLVYHELSGYTLASNMLRQDAGATLESLLRGLFADAIAWYEDYAFLRGTGTGQPRGILSCGALVKVATADSLTLANIAKMMKVHLTRPNAAGPSPNAVWIMHSDAVEDLIQLNDLYNVNWIQNARDSLPVALFGKPIIFSEKMPAKAGSGADPTYCLLADLSYYIVYSRQALQIDFSEHYKFIDNQGTWRFVTLVDGQPWLEKAVYEADGSTQKSPFVCSKHT